MKPLKKIMQTALKPQQTRFRDKRGWYASELTSCARELYWKATGEKETNPTDFVGMMRMLVGKAVEEQLTAQLVSQAHHVGLHQVGTQIQVGSSNPNIDGNLDALVYEAENNKRYVIEYKTKSGAGADFFKMSYDPGDSYMAQMGIYLKDLSEKGITNEGCFIFVLLSDKSFGEMIQIDCKYENGVVTAYRMESSTGDTRALHFSYDVDHGISRIREIEKAVEEKQCPPPTYQYKHELTPAFLSQQSDYALKAAIAGQKILGDWQPRYSRYFTKAMEIDGTSREYTEDELRKLKSEFNNRLTPTGRVRKQIA